MSKNVKHNDDTYSDVSEIEVPVVGGGTAKFKDEDEIVTPSGTKQITANGTYDVTEYESTEVNVPTGGVLPTLTNPASASDILSGKEAIDGNGAKLTGTCTFDADTSDADATAADIAKNKTAYVNGQKVVGTHEEAAGGLVPFATYEIVVAEDIAKGAETVSGFLLENQPYGADFIDHIPKGLGYQSNPREMNQFTYLVFTLTNSDNTSNFREMVGFAGNVYKDADNKIHVSGGRLSAAAYGSSGEDFQFNYVSSNQSATAFGEWLLMNADSFSVKYSVLNSHAGRNIKAGTYQLKFYDVGEAVR